MFKLLFIILIISLFSMNALSNENQSSEEQTTNSDMKLNSQEQQEKFEESAIKEKENIKNDKQENKSRDYGDPCLLNPNLPVCS